MAMSCMTGGKECTGCMACYDDREVFEEEERNLTKEQKEDFFECLDGAKEGIMEMYDLSEDQALDLFTEFIER